MERERLAHVRRLAERLGLEGDAQGNLHRWARGASNPGYHHTLMLLEEAGFLTEEALAFLREPGRPESREGELDSAEIARRQKRAEQAAEKLRPPERTRRERGAE